MKTKTKMIYETQIEAKLIWFFIERTKTRTKMISWTKITLGVTYINIKVN